MHKLGRFPQKGIRTYNEIVALSKKKRNLNKTETKRLLGMNIALNSIVHDFVAADLRAMYPLSVLDIGCGDGRLLAKLARTKGFKGSKMFGIDRSQKAINKARKRHGRMKRLINFSTGTNTKIPYPEKFDLIITCLSFHEWKDRRSSIPYILSRLNERGSFILYDTLPINERVFRSYWDIKPNVQKNKVMVRVVYQLR